MWRARQRASRPSERSPIASPPTSIVPEVGRSRPPRRFRRVVFTDPEGPIRARNSPLATSRFSPFRISIRSSPRRKTLCTSSTRTRGLPLSAIFAFSFSIGCLSLHLDRIAVLQIGRPLDHHPVPLVQPRRHDRLVPLPGAQAHGPALD